MSEDPNSTLAILQALARALPPEAIDELWIFPPRRVGAGQSTVVVASAFEQTTQVAPGAPAVSAASAEAAEQTEPAAVNPETHPTEGDDVASAEAPAPEGAPDDEVASDRRRILTARFTVAKNARSQPELRHELTEHGAAPAERISRVVDGVFRRLDDEPEPPRHARIAGDRDRWAELLADLTATDAQD